MDMAPLSVVFEAGGAAAAGWAVLLFSMALAVITVGVRFVWSWAFHAAALQADDCSSHPRLDQKVPAIFLSHSGRQKDFVERLYNELKRANHTAFLDKYSLPKGERFPANICQAARGCKVGVVVLSDDFLNSKWPMLELEILVSQRGPGAIVLPLFYKLSPKDLKARTDRLKSKWTWTKCALDDANRRIRLIEALDKFNGVEYANKGITKTHYIESVVQHICKLVADPISYNLDFIQGQQRLAEVVASHLSDSAGQEDTVRMVGLHGIGGLGKTTICKIMVNFYSSLYLGKSYLLQLPSDGDIVTIVLRCKEALKTLAHLDDEALNKATDFDQVVQLMKENLRQHDVFLAIDNVGKSCKDRVERILATGFSSDSKILVTSQSDQVLKLLLGDHGNTYQGPLPTPNEDEALQIFQERLCRGNVKALAWEGAHVVLKRAVLRCRFSGSYHALALRALGQYVMSVHELEHFENIEHHLPLILKEISNRDLENVEDVIRLRYEKLPEHKKRLFIDIVVVVVGTDKFTRYEDLHLNLSILYKLEFNRFQITNLIHELALDGLIQLEDDQQKGSERRITVHDLYSDLAWSEARSSPTFLTDESAEEIEWERLERVVLTSVKSASFVRKLLQHKCPKLQVLQANDVDFPSALDLGLMPSLRALGLESVKLRSIENWSAAKGLAYMALSFLKCDPPLKPIPISSLPCLEMLTIESVNIIESPLRLDGSQHLRLLALAEASVFKKGEEANYFNSLTKLEYLVIEHFNSITRALDLNALGRLRWLKIEGCCSVERIEGLDALQELEILRVLHCPLKNLDGLGALLKLGYIQVTSADQLKRIPDLRGLSCLTRLQLSSNALLKELGGLSAALKIVSIRDCGALKRMPNMSGLSVLEALDLQRNQSMEKLEGLQPALKQLNVHKCDAVKKITAPTGNLTGLETLDLFRNRSLEELVLGLTSPSLKRVCIRYCMALKKMPNFSDLPSLQKLELDLNEGMQEVGAAKLSPACFDIKCRGPGIEKLGLIDGEWTASSMKRLPSELQTKLCESHLKVGADVGCLPSHLTRLYISRCDALVKLEVGCLSRLRSLSLRRCTALEEIGDLSALHNLKSLKIFGCPKLKKVGGLPTQKFVRLELSNCPPLEGSSLPDVSSIRKDLILPPHL